MWGAYPVASLGMAGCCAIRILTVDPERQRVSAIGVARSKGRYSTFPPSIILFQRFCISSGLTTSLVAARNQR